MNVPEVNLYYDALGLKVVVVVHDGTPRPEALSFEEKS
jgi:hypothetical protein